MGQVEVYQWLLNRRLAGDHRYFTAVEIRKGLVEAGITGGVDNVRSDILRLEAFKFLEVKTKGNFYSFHRTWRLSSAYLPKTPKTIKQKSQNIQISKILSIPDAAKNPMCTTKGDDC